MPLKEKLLDHNGNPFVFESPKILAKRKVVGTFGSEARFGKTERMWKHYTELDKQQANDHVDCLVGLVLDKFNVPPKSKPQFLSRVSSNKRLSSRKRGLLNSEGKERPRVAMSSLEMDAMYNDFMKRLTKNSPVKKKVICSRNLCNAKTPVRLTTIGRLTAYSTEKQTIRGPLLKSNKQHRPPLFSLSDQKTTTRNKTKKNTNEKKSTHLSNKDKVINALATKKYLSKLYIKIIQQHEKLSNIRNRLLNKEGEKLRINGKMIMSELFKVQDKAAKLIQRAFKRRMKVISL
jgi:hypothetical protein